MSTDNTVFTCVFGPNPCYLLPKKHWLFKDFSLCKQSKKKNISLFIAIEL